MFKNFTQQLFTRLSRHLPRRLVQRTPMTTGKSDAAIPANLAAHCLQVAAMDEPALWRTFGSHPEGLTAAEVQATRALTAKTPSRRNNRPAGGCICGPATATLLTCC